MHPSTPTPTRTCTTTRVTSGSRWPATTDWRFCTCTTSGLQTLGLFALGTEIARFTGAGRAGNLSPEMIRGATFTVTNFGPEGGRFATPIVRPPQVAILGFGAVRVRPIVDGDAVVAAPALPISLSADHRII